jgi:PAS domain S-box-containing protein/putative nucleotidyltransferase with HDIG domain
LQGKFKYNILCVDDNQNNLYSLNALLSTIKNINSIEVLDAKSALDILLVKKIDLILCDVQMPDINGFDLAKMIKSNKRTKEIPIIFVTAVFKSQEFIEQGFEIGAVDYITKPIDDNQLLNKITLYLKIFDEKNRALQNEKRFYDISQSMSDGIYTVDLLNNVTFINNRALELLGYENKDLMGKNIHEYIHYKDINNQQILSNNSQINKVILKAQSYINNNEHFIKKDGSFLPVSVMAKPLYDDNKVVGVVVVFKDKSAEELLNKLQSEKVKNQEQIIYTMIEILESRDSYTAGHTKRVAQYCELIAKEMQYSEEDIEFVKTAAWLHDIGKVSTPDSVLLKPGKLDEEEYETIKKHLDSGYDILKGIDQYKHIAEIIREHHERYDGKGYPQGLKGEEIKPLSRIMIVADAFDAMTTNRIYKPKKSVDEALKELEELSMVQFHPDVVSAAMVALKGIEIDMDISQHPRTLLEEQRFSHFYKDKLTSLFSFEYFELVYNHYLNEDNAYINTVKLNNFSSFNKKFGWSIGDKFLIDFASFLKTRFNQSIVFRVEGDDFMIVSKDSLGSIENIISEFISQKSDIIEFTTQETFIKDIKNNFDKLEI